MKPKELLETSLQANFFLFSRFFTEKYVLKASFNQIVSIDLELYARTVLETSNFYVRRPCSSSRAMLMYKTIRLTIIERSRRRPFPNENADEVSSSVQT